jgi:phospholipase/carboxylesterase
MDLEIKSDCVHLFLGEGAEQSAPGLLLLHDSGADEKQLLSIAQLIVGKTGAGILALRGWYPRAEGFSLLAESAETDVDQALFLERASRISTFLDWATPNYGINPQRLLCLGLGEGATLAAALLFVHSDLLGGAILIDPRNPFRPKPLPALPCYPILLFTESKDQESLGAEQRTLEETLVQCGCSVRRHRVHFDRRMEDEIVRKARDWFKKVSQTDISIACAI